MRKVILAALTAAVVAGPLAGAVLAKSKAAPGRCGENMYYSAKAHKCVDARDSNKSTI